MSKQFKLSNPSKLNSESFALPVSDEVCLGRYKQNSSEMLDKCKSCYADNRGFYAMPGTKAVRDDNLALFKADNKAFVAWMIGKLNRKKNKQFRWFDSGDIASIDFLSAMIEIAELTPDTTHWIPTTTWNYPDRAFQAKLQVLQSLKNVRLRASNPANMQVLSQNTYPLQSVVVNELKQSSKDMFYCPASNQAGKCGDCKACYNPNIKTIAYLKH